MNPSYFVERTYHVGERFYPRYAVNQHLILPIIVREDLVIIGMDYQKFKYCEDTDIDDVNGINQTTQHVYNFEACFTIVTWHT